MGGGAAADSRAGTILAPPTPSGSEPVNDIFRRLAAMPFRIRDQRWLGSLAVAGSLALMAPQAAAGHSELKSSEPGDGATIPSPFSGPVVLTFSDHLADGSKAVLIGPDGSIVATATVEASAPTMTFMLSSPLAAGAYQVQWTSIGDDGDLLRGIVRFTVAAAPSSAPSSEPSASGPGTSFPSPTATGAAATPAPSPTSSTGTGATGSEVLLPIAIALVVATAGALYLVRRNRPA